MSSHASRHLKSVVAGNIAAARSKRAWTQRELAGEIGADPMLVSRWERGKHMPNAVYEGRLAAALFDGDVSALYREPSRAAA